MLIVPALATVLALVGPAAADVESRKRVAVLEFSSSGELKATELQLLTDQARAGTLRALPSDGYLVMTRESTAAIVRQMGGKECTEGECEVETLQNIGADYGVVGSVTFLAPAFQVIIKLFDSRSGALLATERVQAENTAELLDLVEARTAALVQQGLDTRGKSTVRFGAGIKLVLPQVTVAPSDGGALKDLNIDAEEALESARALDGKSKVTPERKARAWCRLAAITQGNPYQQAAQQACDGWKQYANDLADLHDKEPDDYDKLTRYLALKTPTKEEKLRAADAFMETYSQLPDSRMVKQVRVWRDKLAGSTSTDPASPSVWPRLLKGFAAAGMTGAAITALSLGLAVGGVVVAIASALPFSLGITSTTRVQAVDGLLAVLGGGGIVLGLVVYAVMVFSFFYVGPPLTLLGGLGTAVSWFNLPSADDAVQDALPTPGSR